MIIILLVFCSFITSTVAECQCQCMYQCTNIGDFNEYQIFYDPTCSTGDTLGCNAGGQGQNCRFCGFEGFVPCPQTTTSTSSTSSSVSTSTSNNQGSTLSPVTNAPLTDWEKAPDPVKRKYVNHPVKKSARIENHFGPIPTNSWYQNLLLGNGDLITQLYPIQVQAKDAGLVFSVADRKSFIVEERYVLQPFVPDWTYKTTSQFTSRKIRNLKDISVTVFYSFLSGSMEIPLVPGMAFTTAIYKGLVPVLSTIRAILSVKVDNGATFRNGETTSIGNKFVVNLNSNTFWVIFSSEKISFKISGNELTGTAFTSTILKTALVGSTDNSAAWNDYASGYVSSAELSYQVNGDLAVLQYNWNIIGSKTALMYALPHHLAHLVGAKRTGIMGSSIKGEMEAIAGNNWVMRIPLSTISWTAKNQIDPTKRQAVLNALKNDQNLKATAPDPYWFGLELARSGRLALIADELGETAIATKIRNSMKEAIIPWLEGTNNNTLR
jgi:endo-1,3(4)-beta-glucanase